MAQKKGQRKPATPPPTPPAKSFNVWATALFFTVLAVVLALAWKLWFSFTVVPPVYVPKGIPERAAHTRERHPSVPFTLPPAHKIPKMPINAPDPEKAAAVREAFEVSWAAYKRNAWGKDEYHPLSESGTNLLLQDNSPLGFTIIDALDMLILLGLKDEYVNARNWIRDDLTWDIDGRLNVFETTIRVMGGLLSASALMLDPPAGTLPASPEDSAFFLSRAQELAERLLPAFDTPHGLPKREVNLLTGESFYDQDNHNTVSLAEATTIQLEFKYLAERTGDKRYWLIAERPMTVALHTMVRSKYGVLPIFIDPGDGEFVLSEIRLGSRGDSFYEYLVKQYLQTNRTESVYRDMYEHAFDDIKSKLLKDTPWTSPPLVHTLELYPKSQPEGPVWVARTKQDHLVCFLGGTIMLGATVIKNGTLHPPKREYGASIAMREDWRVGHELIRSCMDTYTNSKTGLGAEIVFFMREKRSPTDTRTWTVKRYVICFLFAEGTHGCRIAIRRLMRATSCGPRRWSHCSLHFSSQEIPFIVSGVGKFLKVFASGARSKAGWAATQALMTLTMSHTSRLIEWRRAYYYIH